MSLTDEQATAALEDIKLKSKRLSKIMLVVYSLLTLAVFTLVVSKTLIISKGDDFAGDLVGAILASCFISVLVCLLAKGVETLYRDAAGLIDAPRLLRPIAGTRYCEDALEYIQKQYPAVLEWRDIAVKERGQLRYYDCEMLEALCKITEREREEAEAAEKWNAACREVHGISNTTPSA